MAQKPENRYKQLIEDVFFDASAGYVLHPTEILFERERLEAASLRLGIKLPKNIGDILYAFRYRTPLPNSILETQPEGMEWILESIGRSRYKFLLVPLNRIVPNSALLTINIPDSTPEIITMYSLNDEQALLAKLRYNRLIDIFLKVTAYPLQSHMRTQVKGTGQIEIDEIYVALDQEGKHYIIPVQAKGGKDKHASVQTKQDIAWAVERFPDLLCRSVSAQFMDDNRIAMFELGLQDSAVCIIDEKHYRLSSVDGVIS